MIKNTYILFLILLIVGCKSNNKPVEIPLNLSNIECFSLDTIVKQDVDSFYILAPYGYRQLMNLNLGNSDFLKAFLNTNLNDGAPCVLVYVKNNNILNYSILERSAVDFASVDENYQGMSIHTVFCVDSTNTVRVKID